MSTFRGLIREIPGIRVDYFEKPEAGTLFFLSHCHTDHMVGITSLATLAKEKSDPDQTGVKLVVSQLTKSILTNLHPELKDLMDVIEIGNPNLYTLADGQNVMCTAVPAGHCPGSVMFYFETQELNVLYTGDFRWKASDLRQLKILETIKQDLKAVYLDSTFLLPEFDAFPDQKESVSVVVKLVKEWLGSAPVNRVFLEIPARFGSEFLLLELYKRTRLNMHLCDVDQGCLLPFIPEMRDFIVPQLNDSVKIVVGMRNTQLNPRFKWRTIRPSAMYWTNWKRGDAIVKRDERRKELFRICYSSHSSRSEIVALLKLLNPNSISLNVQPEGHKDRRLDELRQLQEEMKEADKKKLKVVVAVETEEPKYAFVQGYVPPSADAELYKTYLSQIRADDSEEEEPLRALPIRKRIRVDD